MVVARSRLRVAAHAKCVNFRRDVIPRSAGDEESGARGVSALCSRAQARIDRAEPRSTKAAHAPDDDGPRELRWAAGRGEDVPRTFQDHAKGSRGTPRAARATTAIITRLLRRTRRRRPARPLPFSRCGWLPVTREASVVVPRSNGAAGLRDACGGSVQRGPIRRRRSLARANPVLARDDRRTCVTSS